MHTVVQSTFLLIGCNGRSPKLVAEEAISLLCLPFSFLYKAYKPAISSFAITVLSKTNTALCKTKAIELGNGHLPFHLLPLVPYVPTKFSAYEHIKKTSRKGFDTSVLDAITASSPTAAVL